MYTVFVTSKIEKHLIIFPSPLLLVPEYPYLPLNSNWLAFFVNVIFQKYVEVRVSKLQIHFFKDFLKTFFSRNIFPLHKVIC